MGEETSGDSTPVISMLVWFPSLGFDNVLVVVTLSMVANAIHWAVSIGLACTSIV